MTRQRDRQCDNMLIRPSYFSITVDMSNDDELREAIASALENPEEDTNTAIAEVEAAPLGETLDEMLTRHRKEIRQLNAETTALKKTATKGEKKKKKEVLTQIAVMESEMNKRHEDELRQHQPVAGDPANVEPEQEDEVSEEKFYIIASGNNRC
jgi:chlorite dismutase